MNYLIFDTETNGLPRNYKAHYSDVDNWPRVVQLAWMLCDEQGEVISQECAIIKPVGFTIPANMIHGISQEHAFKTGSAALDVFEHFCNMCFTNRAGSMIFKDYPALVAHNIGFDLPIVSAELMRLNVGGLSESLNTKFAHHCTQAIGTNYCKFPNRNNYPGYKWPRLSELHRFLFNEDFDGAHDAMNDVKATARCFFELKRRGLVA